MKWIAISPLFFLLTSCIFTEGTMIVEPEDIAVTPQAYQFAPFTQCGVVDVTDAT
ncbi:MAG: hypothetical protein Q8R83_08600 [Legionellaceae bacterium]|nr:hypothetical protein [Legionellaceae bacterium]